MATSMYDVYQEQFFSIKTIIQNVPTICANQVVYKSGFVMKSLSAISSVK